MMRPRSGAVIQTKNFQEIVGTGRAPVYKAVSQPAAETISDVRPRDCIAVASINLVRNRGLAELCCDTVRFVAEETAGPPCLKTVSHSAPNDAYVATVHDSTNVGLQRSAGTV